MTSPTTGLLETLTMSCMSSMSKQVPLDADYGTEPLSPAQWDLVAKDLYLVGVLARKYAHDLKRPDLVVLFEDTVLAQLVKAARYYDPTKGDWKPIRCWKMRHAYRRCLQLMRKNPRPCSLDAPAGDEGSVTIADYVADDTRPEWTPMNQAEVVDHLMQCLTPAERDTIQAVYWGGKKCSQVAQDQGKSHRAVRSMVASAYQRMRECARN